MKKIITTVLLCIAFTTPASAADSPFYAGLQVGDNYVGGLGGYQIDKMFSVEVHYIEFDSISTPFVSTDASSFGVAGVAMFPMNLKNAPPFALYAKAGVERTSVDVNFPPYGYSETDMGLMLGGGAQYDFNKNVSARLGLDIAGEADSLYISAILKF